MQALAQSLLMTIHNVPPCCYVLAYYSIAGLPYAPGSNPCWLTSEPIPPGKPDSQTNVYAYIGFANRVNQVCFKGDNNNYITDNIKNYFSLTTCFMGVQKKPLECLAF